MEKIDYKEHDDEVANKKTKRVIAKQRQEEKKRIKLERKKEREENRKINKQERKDIQRPQQLKKAAKVPIVGAASRKGKKIDVSTLPYYNGIKRSNQGGKKVKQREADKANPDEIGEDKEEIDQNNGKQVTLEGTNDNKNHTMPKHNDRVKKKERKARIKKKRKVKDSSTVTMKSKPHDTTSVISSIWRDWSI